MEVTVRLGVDQARELALAAEAGVRGVYVDHQRVRDAIERIRDAVADLEENL
jgi:hypothetical protein